jgi:hypothetical protein
MISPRASRAPWFRAVAGPRFSWRRYFTGNVLTISAVPSREPSSTDDLIVGRIHRLAGKRAQTIANGLPGIVGRNDDGIFHDARCSFLTSGLISRALDVGTFNEVLQECPGRSGSASFPKGPSASVLIYRADMGTEIEPCRAWSQKDKIFRRERLGPHHGVVEPAGVDPLENRQW